MTAVDGTWKRGLFAAAVAVTVGALRHGRVRSGNRELHTVRNGTGFQFNLLKLPRVILLISSRRLGVVLFV